MGTLLIGNRTVDRDRAREHARTYLSGGRSSYPSYDGYDADHASGPLVDADFLAPVLLNVSHLRVRTYAGLQRSRQKLQSILDAIPPDLGLEAAVTEDLLRLGELFAVVDHKQIHGAKGTVLAKVLHRKRPRFIPLYDEQVRRVYQDGDGAPVPPVEDRSWSEFMPLFATAVQRDLTAEWDFWTAIAADAEGPPITQLRALDIVAWWAGDSGRPRGVRRRRKTA